MGEKQLGEMEKNTLISFANLERVLSEYAEEVRSLYKENLIESDRLATEDLLNSVQTEVVRSGQWYEVTMTLADYWKYVEYDTKPHWPPTDAILKWIRVKPVIPRPNTLPARRQLAYLIGRKIAEEGTTGSHDLQAAVTDCNRKYESLLAQALQADVGESARLLLSGFKTY